VTMQTVSEFEFEFFHSIQINDINGVSANISPGIKCISLDGLVEQVDESEDGTDVVRINVLIADSKGRDIRVAYYKSADWFFDKMFNVGREHPIHKKDSAPIPWLKALTSNCIIDNAKAMRDDRDYRTLAVDEGQIEINIKYQYFKVDLALSAGVSPSIIVNIKGLFDSNWDELPTLLYEIPFLDLISPKL
jgi:hypothetical protein